MVTVYDPDTLRAVRVREDDTRAIDFLSRAEAQREQRENRKKRKEVQDGLTKATTTTLQSEELANVRNRIASRVSVAAGAARAAGRKGAAVLGGSAASGVAALGIAGSAAAVAGAFALGYGIGELGRRAWKALQPDEIAYRQANAFRKARRDFKDRYGRDPNREELQAMSAGFRDSYQRALRARSR